MPDTVDDTMSHKIRNTIDWTKALSSIETPFYSTLSRSSFPMRPIIGHTPEKRVQRFIWSRVCRVGYALHDRFARFDKHEGDGYDSPEVYWLKRDWDWLEAAGKRSTDAMPKPIYDPNWVRPKPLTVTWGMGDYTAPNPDILGVGPDGEWVRRA